MKTTNYSVRRTKFMNYIHESDFTDEQIEQLAYMYVASLKALVVDIRNDVGSRLDSVEKYL